jgi:hypothetical protein
VIVRNIKPSSGDVLLVPGDIHFDQQDDAALELMVLVALASRVNRICLVGDTFESAGISRHVPLRRRSSVGRGTIRSEYRAAAPWFAQFKAIGVKGCDALTGNHEAWWRELQEEYPGLSETDWPEVYGDLFDGWHVYAEHTALKFGPLLVCHGHRLRGSLSRASAAAVLANYPGQNTLYGHTHRVDACITPSYKYGQPVRHGAWTIGHLKRSKLELIDPHLGPHSERHLQGFALVSFYEVEGEMRFNVETVTIDRAESGRPYCIVGGVFYD